MPFPVEKALSFEGRPMLSIGSVDAESKPDAFDITCFPQRDKLPRLTILLPVDLTQSEVWRNPIKRVFRL